MMILLFAVIICLSLAGCSLQDKIEDYSREQCYLNKENVTQFSYKGNDYTILADTVSNSGLGEWIGYIQQLAAVDESGKILLQENLKTATFQTLADLADLVDKAPNDAYIIPFLNVYAAPNADDYLIVDINGGYHKAVIDENIKGTDTVFDFKDIEQSMSGKFEINPQNATQLLCDGTVYLIPKQHELSRRIAELTEELEELKSEKDMLLHSLECTDDAGITAVKKDISTMEATLKKLSQQEEKYTAELNDALQQYAELKSQSAEFDSDKLQNARLALRPAMERSAVDCVQSAYGDRYQPLMMYDSKRDVSDMLHEEAETRSIRERLRQK